jgi:hypothetical protein
LVGVQLQWREVSRGPVAVRCECECPGCEMTSAASNKRTSNKTRRRNAAIAFLSNISLDGSYSGATDVQPLSHFKSEVAGDEDDDEDASMGNENEPPVATAAAAAAAAAAPVERGAVPGAAAVGAEQAAVCDAAATECRNEPDTVTTLTRSLFRERSLSSFYYLFIICIMRALELPMEQLIAQVGAQVLDGWTDRLRAGCALIASQQPD